MSKHRAQHSGAAGPLARIALAVALLAPLAACGGGASTPPPPPPPPPLAITTMLLPDGVIGTAYNQTLMATGGSPPYSWSLAVGSGPLPDGLSLSAAGVISGTPTATGTFNFVVQVADSGAPQQTATQALTIRVIQGRNDCLTPAGNCAGPTPLTTAGNLTVSASISPFADPVTGPANPDTDYYRITANAGATVTVEIFARRLPVPSPLDSVIEIVDGAGTRFNTCRDPGDDLPPAPIIQDSTPILFDDPCINDDIELGVILDSKLELFVPGSGTVTFFVRVLDWRGDARPDMLYQISITGAN